MSFFILGQIDCAFIKLLRNQLSRYFIRSTTQLLCIIEKYRNNCICLFGWSLNELFPNFFGSTRLGYGILILYLLYVFFYKDNEKCICYVKRCWIQDTRRLNTTIRGYADYCSFRGLCSIRVNPDCCGSTLLQSPTIHVCKWIITKRL